MRSDCLLEGINLLHENKSAVKNKLQQICSRVTSSIYPFGDLLHFWTNVEKFTTSIWFIPYRRDHDPKASNIKSKLHMLLRKKGIWLLQKAGMNIHGLEELCTTKPCIHNKVVRAQQAPCQRQGWTLWKTRGAHSVEQLRRHRSIYSLNARLLLSYGGGSGCGYTCTRICPPTKGRSGFSSSTTRNQDFSERSTPCHVSHDSSWMDGKELKHVWGEDWCRGDF